MFLTVLGYGMGNYKDKKIQVLAEKIGGSAKVSLRGIRSASGDNQPLYVIDGVPMLNIGTEQAYSAIGCAYYSIRLYSRLLSMRRT